MSQVEFNLDPEADVAELASQLQRDGWISFGRLWSEGQLQAARLELECQFGDLATADWGDGRAVKVSGRGRYLAPVKMTGILGEPEIFANPTVLSVARSALGEDAILENFGVVAALPGATDQRLHRDISLLFDHQIGALVPAYALTFVLPLVQPDESVGSTALLTGSHRWLERPDDAPTEAAYPPLGGAMMWDFRTLHRGTANRSDRVRPFLLITYARPWWRDHGNYKGFRRARLQISAETISALDPDLQKLFVHLVDG